MNTGKIIADLRELRDWKQKDLAERSGVSRMMIGKYERGEAIPSIEAAKKIADAFEVSLDHLAGEGMHTAFDKKTLQRLEEIQRLSPPSKTSSFFSSIPSCEIPRPSRRTLRKDNAGNWSQRLLL